MTVGVLDRLVQETRGSDKDWWGPPTGVAHRRQEEVLTAEAWAVSIRTWQPLTVPGLCQTREYARALIGKAIGLEPDVMEGRAILRSQRRQILSGDDAPRYAVVLGQAALSEQVGDSRVMRGQIQSLIEMTRAPRATIHILPSHWGGPGPGFHLYELPGSVSPIVEVESMIDNRFEENPGEAAAYTKLFAKFLANALDEQESVKSLREALASW